MKIKELPKPPFYIQVNSTGNIYKLFGRPDLLNVECIDGTQYPGFIYEKKMVLQLLNDNIWSIVDHTS